MIGVSRIDFNHFKVILKHVLNFIHHHPDTSFCSYGNCFMWKSPCMKRKFDFCLILLFIHVKVASIMNCARLSYATKLNMKMSILMSEYLGVSSINRDFENNYEYYRCIDVYVHVFFFYVSCVI